MSGISSLRMMCWSIITSRFYEGEGEKGGGESGAGVGVIAC
jgi:hypothetical protein